jgi:hypothetical protein
VERLRTLALFLRCNCTWLTARKKCGALEALRGVTLVEATLYIAVSLGTIIGGLAVYGQALERSKAATAVRQISSMVQSIRQIFDSQSDFSSLSASVLLAAGAIPPGSFTASSAVLSPWGGVTVSAAPGNAHNFVVTLDNLPVSACTRLGVYSASGEGVVADNVLNFEVRNSDGVFVSADAEVQYGRPTDGVSASEAASVCGIWAGEVPEVRWTFAR